MTAREDQNKRGEFAIRDHSDGRWADGGLYTAFPQRRRWRPFRAPAEIFSRILDAESRVRSPRVVKSEQDDAHNSASRESGDLAKIEIKRKDDPTL